MSWFSGTFSRKCSYHLSPFPKFRNFWSNGKRPKISILLVELLRLVYCLFQFCIVKFQFCIVKFQFCIVKFDYVKEIHMMLAAFWCWCIKPTWIKFLLKFLNCQQVQLHRLWRTLETRTRNAAFQIWRQTATCERSSHFYFTSSQQSISNGLPSGTWLPDWKLHVVEISIRSKTLHGNGSYPNAWWMAWKYG